MFFKRYVLLQYKVVMTESKTLDIHDDHDDDHDDLYKDIGDFHFDKELAKLEESNKAYLEDIQGLSQQVKLLNEENTELRKVNDILVTNISILLKTAKSEISRKQSVIEECRKKIECMHKKNGFKVEDEIKVLEVCKTCRNRESKNDGSEIEEGEIVKSNDEDSKFISETERRKSFNYRDKKDHVDNHEKIRSYERSRGRSIDNYSSRSHRNSKHSEETHSQSSVRNSYRHRSADERRYFDRRERSRDKSVFSSNHSHGDNRRRKEYSSRERKDLRTSQERHRSHRRTFDPREKENSPKHKHEHKSDKKSVETVDSSSKLNGIKENKSKDLKFHSDSSKNRTGKRENDKIEGGDKEKCEPVKRSESNEPKDKKCSDPKVKKKCETNSFERQSVLAGLYDENFFCNRFSEPPKQENASVQPEIVNEATTFPDSSSDDSWSLCFGEKSESPKKKKTLYTKRMEAKLKQKVKEEELASKVSNVVEDSEKVIKFEEKCPDEKIIYSQDEKEEGEITLNNDEINSESDDTAWKGESIEKSEVLPAGSKIDSLEEKVSEKDEKTCENSGTAAEDQQETAEKNFEQSLGENIIKNLLLLQKPEENQEIKEYSPLKNNYKLSKLSPPKPDSKQHILDYYNLKPAQQINTIEPEILNFSLSMPETPGKNFPFGTLDNRELVREYGDCNSKQPNEEKILDSPEDSRKNPKDDNKEIKDDNSEKEDSRLVLKSDNEEKNSNHTGKEKRKSSPRQKVKRGKVQGKMSSKIITLGNKKKNKDAVTYQIRTRSKTGSESRSVRSVRSVKEDGKGKSSSKVEAKSKSAAVKRKRERASSDEDGKEKSKRKKVRSASRSEESREEHPEGEEKEEEREMKSEISQSNDITYFEVFQSVSDVGNEVAAEEKTVLDDLSLSNISDCRGNTNTTSSDVSNKFKNLNESKGSLLSGGNSDDSSTFKVLRSYLMLSANDESDLDVFSEDTTSSSGEYSDSGASAFVDLL